MFFFLNYCLHSHSRDFSKLYNLAAIKVCQKLVDSATIPRVPSCSRLLNFKRNLVLISTSEVEEWDKAWNGGGELLMKRTKLAHVPCEMILLSYEKIGAKCESGSEK